MDDKLKRLKALTWEGLDREWTDTDLEEIKTLCAGREGAELVRYWTAICCLFEGNIKKNLNKHSCTENMKGFHRVVRDRVLEFFQSTVGMNMRDAPQEEVDRMLSKHPDAIFLMTKEDT